MKEMKCNGVMQDCGVASVPTQDGSKPAEPLVEHSRCAGTSVFTRSNLVPSLGLLLLCAAVWTVGTELIKAKIKARAFGSSDPSPSHPVISQPASPPGTDSPTCALGPATVAPQTDIRMNRLPTVKDG